MSRLDDLSQMKDLVERLQRSCDQEEGALQHLKSELKEMGFDTIEAAEEEAERLERTVAKKRRTLDRRLREFEEKYGSQLD